MAADKTNGTATSKQERASRDTSGEADQDLLRLAQQADGGSDAHKDGDVADNDGGGGEADANGDGAAEDRRYDLAHRRASHKKKQADDEDEEQSKDRLKKLTFLLKKSGVYAQIMQQKMDQEREQRIRDSQRAASAVAPQSKVKDGAITKGVAKGVVTGRSTRAGDASEKAKGENAPPAKVKRERTAKRRGGGDESDDQAADVGSGGLKEDELRQAKENVEQERSAKRAKLEGDDGDGADKKVNGDAGTGVGAGDDDDHIAGQRVQPAAITGAQLKDYQLEGLDWMISLYENGLNGILADEMGLGKTLQTIAFLAHLRSKGVWGPFMVVAPKSVASNWVKEIERFTTDMPAIVYHGNKAERQQIMRSKMSVPSKSDPARFRFPVVVTTYEMVIADMKQLQHYRWKYIVVDEGHRLKNMECRLIQELKKLDSANRLLLTGTPLHNNLQELWSLLNFILPDIFDDLETFNKWFDFSDLQNEGGSARILHQEMSTSVVSQLHEILKPFLLRRLKKDVLQLPPKKEYILYAPLTKRQKDLYDALLDGNIHGHLMELMTGLSRAEIEALMAEEQGVMLPWGNVKSGASSRNASPATPNGSGAGTPAKRGRGRPPKGEATPTTPAESSRAGSAEASPVGSTASRTRGSARRATRGVRYAEETDDAFLRRLEAGETDDVVQRRAREEAQRPRSFAEEVRRGKIHHVRQARKEVGNMRLQNLAAQARKVCCHPFLFYWPRDRETGDLIVDEQLIDASGKMLLLNRILDALMAEPGRKVLIFSQFTTVLDVIQDWLEDSKGRRAFRIDGQTDTAERDAQMNEFNTDVGEDSVRIFLLSTRAGGLGVNLVGADTVIFYDSDWNPQVDLQAQDRAHRIGQTKPVLIFRLVTANTIEQHLLRTATTKRELEKLVIQDEKFLGLTKRRGGAGGGASNGAGLVAKRPMALLESLVRLQVEKIHLAERGDEIISDENLARLLDRSEAAFQRQTGWVSSRDGGVRDGTRPDGASSRGGHAGEAKDKSARVKAEAEAEVAAAFEVSEEVQSEMIDSRTEQVAEIFRQ